MNSSQLKIKRRWRRQRRIRKRLLGTSERPRLSVFRSNKNIYAQIIDDLSGRTLACASTVAKELRQQLAGPSSNKAAAEAVGKTLAEKAIRHGVKKVEAAGRNQSVIVGNDVKVTVLDIRIGEATVGGSQVRLGFQAPKEVSIQRQEVFDRMKSKTSSGGV